MKFKVVENLPVEIASLLTEARHDDVTVTDQGVGGISDAELAALCKEAELTGSLWLVEQDRVRIRRSDDAD